MSFFNITLALSLLICFGGLCWRLYGWLTHCVEPPCPGASQRLRALPRAIAAAMSRRALKQGLRSLGRNALLQLQVLRQSPLRWSAHFLIFAGFVLLVLMHAMDGVVSYPLLPGYEPTLNPYQFLRDFLGLLVLAGVLLAAGRRTFSRKARRTTKGADWFALALVFAIIGSGFALEAVKITSASVFDDMVEQYYPMPPEEELEALKHFWAAENGVVFAGLTPEPELVQLGAEINEFSCASCHSPTASAFVSRPLAEGLHSAAPVLDTLRADRLLWYLHVLLTFFGLAILPWSKFLHLVTTPLQLMLRPDTIDKSGQTPAAGKAPLLESRRALALDACTHCGACSAGCSVAPVHTVLGNAFILPSEKLQGLKRLMAGGLAPHELEAFAQGSFICTECRRCTEQCPSHIDLQDLWLAAKRELAAREQAEAHGLMVRRTAAEWAAIFRDAPHVTVTASSPVSLTDKRESFWACVQCTTCTSVCPVVAVADDPAAELDLTPQQIMNLMRMGLKDLALGARMVWSCVTCYKCQEHCPQGVKVADVLYELRNIASQQTGKDTPSSSPTPRRKEWS